MLMLIKTPFIKPFLCMLISTSSSTDDGHHRRILSSSPQRSPFLGLCAGVLWARHVDGAVHGSFIPTTVHDSLMLPAVCGSLRPAAMRGEDANFNVSLGLLVAYEGVLEPNFSARSSSVPPQSPLLTSTLKCLLLQDLLLQGQFLQGPFLQCLLLPSALKWPLFQITLKCSLLQSSKVTPIIIIFVIFLGGGGIYSWP